MWISGWKHRANRFTLPRPRTLLKRRRERLPRSSRQSFRFHPRKTGKWCSPRFRQWKHSAHDTIEPLPHQLCVNTTRLYTSCLDTSALSYPVVCRFSKNSANKGRSQKYSTDRKTLVIVLALLSKRTMYTNAAPLPWYDSAYSAPVVCLRCACSWHFICHLCSDNEIVNFPLCRQLPGLYPHCFGVSDSEMIVRCPTDEFNLDSELARCRKFSSFVITFTYCVSCVFQSHTFFLLWMHVGLELLWYKRILSSVTRHSINVELLVFVFRLLAFCVSSMFASVGDKCIVQWMICRKHDSNLHQSFPSKRNSAFSNACFSTSNACFQTISCLSSELGRISTSQLCDAMCFALEGHWKLVRSLAHWGVLCNHT